jgi:hypothetical protein
VVEKRRRWKEVKINIRRTQEEANTKNSRRNVKFEVFTAVSPLLVTANVVPSSPILVTLMMEALFSYET